MVAVVVAMAIPVFVHRWGRLVTDTKVDLMVEPARFMARTLHIWDQSGFFGQVQNQAIGYLFPMGPLFLYGDIANLPAWVTLRIFLLLLVGLAFWGTVRLADALSIGRPWSRLVAGAMYAFCPTFLIMWGQTSAAIFGGVALPWIMLPLVRAKTHQHVSGVALRSAVFVVLTGGINATVTLAALGLPVSFLLIGRRGKQWFRLSWWWGCGMILGILWWALPLVFQGKYGFNFLPYTERARLTANAMSATDLLRGSTNWLSYLGLGHPWTRSGWTIGHTPYVVGATTVVGTLGLVGLMRPTMPHRAWLGGSMAAAGVFMGMGYAGAAGGVAGPTFQLILDGPLTLARNLYKFDPTFRLCLMLGLAHLLGEWRPTRKSRLRIGAATMVVVMGGALFPLLTGRFLPEGTYSGIPYYWYQAADFVTEHQDEGRALLVPTSAFGEYTWGRTMDDPFQPLLDAPWSARTLVPLGGDGSIRYMDTIEDVLVTGRGNPGLSEMLAQGGVRYIIARNDLDWRRVRTARPSVVRRALEESGLEKVASFGRVSEVVGLPEPIMDFGIALEEAKYGALEVWQSQVSTGKTSSVALDSLLVVTGGPEATLPLAERGLLQDRAFVTPEQISPQGLDPLAPPRATFEDGLPMAADWPLVLTDAQRRVNQQFGLVRDSKSYTLAPDENAPGTLLTQQYGFPDARIQATADQRGISAISASSYGSVLLELPELQPAAAIDGDTDTAWVADTWTELDPWLRLDLVEPRQVPYIDIVALADGPWRALITAITVTTDTGSIRHEVEDIEQVQRLSAPSGLTESVTLQLEVVPPFESAAGAGLREVTIPDLVAPRLVRSPDWTAGLHAEGTNPAPFVVLDRQHVNPYHLLRRDIEPILRRSFRLDQAATYTVNATVLPIAGSGLEAVIREEGMLRAQASSHWSDLPDTEVGRMFDNDPRTVWVARPSEPPKLPTAQQPEEETPSLDESPLAPVPIGFDPNPTIELSWDGERTLSELRITASESVGSPPTVVLVSSPAGTRRVELDANLWSEFTPLTTDRVTLTFPELDVRSIVDPETGEVFTVPVGFAELEIPALSDLVPPRMDGDRELTLPCGQGPQLEIDGRLVDTTLTALVGDLVALRPTELELCDGGTLQLPAGDHTVMGGRNDAFVVTSMTLRPGELAPASAPRAVIETGTWTPAERQVLVGPGPASVLIVHEAFNIGWTASLGDQPLTPIMINAWQQGFLVPAGGDVAMVDLVFAADASFRMGFAVGAMAFVGLFLLTALMSRRRARKPVNWTPWRGLSLLPAAGVGFMVGVLLSPIAGPIAGLGVLVLARRPRAAAWIVLSCALGAGLIATVAAPNAQPQIAAGTFSAPAQMLTAIAMAIAAGISIGRTGRTSDLATAAEIDTDTSTEAPSTPRRWGRKER